VEKYRFFFSKKGHSKRIIFCLTNRCVSMDVHICVLTAYFFLIVQDCVRKPFMSLRLVSISSWHFRTTVCYKHPRFSKVENKHFRVLSLRVGDTRGDAAEPSQPQRMTLCPLLSPHLPCYLFGDLAVFASLSICF